MKPEHESVHRKNASLLSTRVDIGLSPNETHP